ncbi:MAG TPA: biopolymer transporter ExbD [Spirochaetota bacterium]|nr:biopolymer transporter ExbD [Spirochaetota bacterium]HOS32768.1 biopolymer transporter ExbD [Spirochaetota bacterium]HOS56410.1 biopolymer transporter ExbD [Spirochaetota bacterium]HPK62221.1 biopolymer transporter ExbD [Spirochaetota bacterium]HQF76638.1 biopolymer transporter ExbD [Spirochaetota bacterium]
MKFKTAKTNKQGVDLTPILDMMFIILIFFMVSATFELNRSIKMKLPKSFAGESAISKEKILIEVDSAGNISLNGETTEIHNLSNKIKEIDNFSTSTIYLLGDNDTGYKNIIAILDILKVMGISDISLVTEEKTEIE